MTGESFAQVNNPDPFAPPVWRSPVYRTPEFIIGLVQLIRLLGRAAWFVICHPLLDLIAGLLVLDYLNLGWPGLAGVAGIVVALLIVLRLVWPATLSPGSSRAPVRDGWRRWYYRRRWLAVMTITGLAPLYRGRVLIPVIAGVTAGRPRRTGSRSAWSPGSPRPTSPTGPRASRTASACICAGSARSRRA